jgi:hypothetical protein
MNGSIFVGIVLNRMLGPVSISRLDAKEGLRQMGGLDAGIAHGTSLG